MALVGWEKEIMTNYAILLAALATVASGNDDNEIGKAGERGRYQFTRAAWDDCVKALKKDGHQGPFVAWEVGAHIESEASWFAEQWIWKLQKRICMGDRLSRLPTVMSRRPTDVTVEQVLSAWNCGLDRLRVAGWDPKKCPASTREFVAKVKRELRKKNEEQRSKAQ
jgi:hypothetical protein